MRGLCKEAPVENNLFGYVLKTLHEEGRKEKRAIYRKEQPLYVASAQAPCPWAGVPINFPSSGGSRLIAKLSAHAKSSGDFRQIFRTAGFLHQLVSPCRIFQSSFLLSGYGP